MRLTATTTQREQAAQAAPGIRQDRPTARGADLRTRVVRHALLAVAGFVMAALVLAAPALAANPTVAAGSYTVTSESRTVVASADGNTFFHATATIVYAGPLTGTEHDSYDFVVHKDGSIEGSGTGVCAPCTLGARSGPLATVFTIHGSVISGVVVGRVTLTGAGGGLTGIHGGGSYQQNLYTNNNSYAYSYLVAP